MHNRGDYLMKKILLFIMLITSYLNCTPYTLCIDGGGSKTILQVLDDEGRIVPLKKANCIADYIETSASNPNTVRLQGVKNVFQTLFQDVVLMDRDVELSKHFPECHVVAGMAGVSTSENRDIILGIMEEYGLVNENITLLNDGELTLQLIGEQGGILISGTGSICFTKNNGITYQTGGLGPVLGDEGSGYHIGLEALKIGLAHEYGWGSSTSLTQTLRNFFQVSSLKELIGPLYAGNIKPVTIAAAAPLIFEEAFFNHDPAAENLIYKEIQELILLITRGAEMADLRDCEIHLWGGTFKNSYANSLIQLLEVDPIISERGLTLVNHSSSNAAVLYAQKMIASQT